MRDIIHSARQSVSVRRVRRVLPVVALCVFVALSMAPAAAQFGDPSVEEEFSDDFEDGDTDGWSGQGMSTSDTSVEGSVSLQANDDDPDSVGAFPRWDAGPVLDMEDEFTINGTSRIDQGDGTARSGFGQIDTSREGVLLLFSGEYGSTFLAVDGTEEFDESLDHYDNDFDDTWVNWEMYSAGNGTVYAKVWADGESEPSGYTLERDFGATSGQFTIWSGVSPNDRVVLLDSVTIEGQEATDPNLTIDTGQLLQHEESQPYEVTFVQTDPETGRNETIDVTDEAAVTSMNTDGLTVNESANELVATDNESFNDRVTIQAEYNGSVAYTEVAVTSPTVENLEVLPPVWRIGAFLGDWTVFLFVVAMGAGIVGTRIATSFMGLSMMEMVLVIGWFGGYISTGLILTSVFACLFIGLNLAANIDYQVAR